ncbi:DNA-3-methyladenine glycosylase-like [Haliotis rubra]|uniref:DNA-3-methyladenine glycosylase-like n=1 Tax=Haliotis rubra TaxID=36100 RepID=UPI001EE5CD5A|nr:DNA-3-methyladenine glycosylase-like [Haliotis rubra]XP_046544347.1 DNA-3-methyladenine glycosylase-like [Haliotis rubra]
MSTRRRRQQNKKSVGAPTAPKVLKTDVEELTSIAGPSADGGSGEKHKPCQNSKLSKLTSKLTKADSAETGADINSEDKSSPYFSKVKSPEELDDSSVEDLGEAAQPKRLSRAFYEQSCEDLGKALLGQVLVRIHNGERLTGRIVETESYLGRRDKAAHSYKGKTDRNSAMFMDPGTAYVYNIYGMYCCMNISSQGEGEAVLLRSLEPVEGKGVMSTIRAANRKKDSPCKPMKDHDLCNGPSKLTQALKIDKASTNQVDLLSHDAIWLEEGEKVPAAKMVVSKRININYAEEWKDKPLRFYELGNRCVSVRDKEAEKLMKDS